MAEMEHKSMTKKSRSSVDFYTSPSLAVEAKWWRGIKTELNNWEKGLAIGEQQRKESLI